MRRSRTSAKVADALLGKEWGQIERARFGVERGKPTRGGCTMVAVVGDVHATSRFFDKNPAEPGPGLVDLSVVAKRRRRQRGQDPLVHGGLHGRTLRTASLGNHRLAICELESMHARPVLPRREPT